MNLDQFAQRGLKAQAAVDDVLSRQPENASGTKPIPPTSAGTPLGGGKTGSSAGAPPNPAQRPRSKKQEAEAISKEHFGIDQKLKSINSMPFINRTAVRNFLLEHAKATRPANKFRRVSEETLRDIHESVRQMLISRVHRTPSKGRTM